MKKHSIALPGEKYVPVADGLRAIFIFIVAWYHIWQQSWLSPNLTIGNFTLDIYPLIRSGYMWVDGMLLLSGFLTFLPYARAMLDKKPLPDAAGFYRKRVARILPSYLFCVLLLFFCDALPNNMYPAPRWMWTDILAHLTFTHTFFSFSYFNTCVNVVLWTLAVEVQFYLIFPLLAKAFTKKPALTFIGMAAAAWLYRGYVTLYVASNNIWINQLIAFMDIYAIGFLGAWIYVKMARSVKPDVAVQILMTGVCAVLLYVLWQLVLRQCHVSGYEALRTMQMRNRFALGSVIMMFLLCASYSLGALRWLLSNRGIRFLAGISFQFYIWHQYLAVLLRRLNIPYSASALPNQDGEILWQWKYTLLAFGIAFVAAVAATYLIERPAQRLILRHKSNKQKEGAA